MKKNNWLNFFKFPLVVVIILTIADQVTKYIIVDNVKLDKEQIPVIEGFFDIVHTRNTGAAWGIFADHTWILTIISFVAALMMIIFFAKLAEERKWQAIGLSFIIGGTIGNLIDRAHLSYVIDFLDFHWHDAYHFPAFNVADSAITVGVFLYALVSMGILDRHKNSEVVKKSEI